MKVSGCTFIRNGETLGFPFIQSIRSILPICDEFIVNVGNSDDSTLEMIRAINNPKIKIVKTTWNDKMKVKGFVYGQQKMIAQYSCTGDWVFYIEGDEIIHENQLASIREAMQQHLDSPNVEALVFDYLHFYGNINTYLWSPHWYRRAPRIIRNSIRSFAPDGLFWTVLDKDNKKARYPKAALANATIYHYGWVRTEQQMTEKLQANQQYWNQAPIKGIDYTHIDAHIFREFTGTHPKGITEIFPKADGLFLADPNHTLTRRERKNRIGLKLESLFNLDLSKKHFSLV